MKALCIITARGGSKRIPRKNIKPFHGKPIIAYSIEAAKASGLFAEVMVSTDDEEISEVAQRFGASVPFLRSPENANDFATTADVLVEVLAEYNHRGESFDTACCVYPTAPFVTPEKLKKAAEELWQQNADVVFPIIKFEASIWRSLSKSDDGKLNFNWPENAVKRSQDLSEAWYDCGQFYFFSVERFLQTKSLLTDNTFGLPVNAMEAQDIDTEADWRLAEFKFAFAKPKSNHS